MEKHVLAKKMFTNELNMGLPLWVLIVYRVETYWLSSKDKVLGAVVSKEGQADSILGHEMSYHYQFH